jgi:hypothetical protein
LPVEELYSDVLGLGQEYQKSEARKGIKEGVIAAKWCLIAAGYLLCV